MDIAFELLKLLVDVADLMVHLFAHVHVLRRGDASDRLDVALPFLEFEGSKDVGGEHG